MYEAASTKSFANPAMETIMRSENALYDSGRDKLVCRKPVKESRLLLRLRIHEVRVTGVVCLNKLRTLPTTVILCWHEISFQYWIAGLAVRADLQTGHVFKDKSSPHAEDKNLPTR